uniref:AlNc14C107G6274 protein n=1 Tax=Albugo laibachii Nc14 TaxID=890382 RepID=F0WI68_9STRA|nr:AlNc14C107G6274 [Albugo laibachii Nc14]|eukprot:CCA20946.1 AlNc14C107G6274 [Albugo laibachii Nc14]
MVRSMIFDSGLALMYWSEAAEYAAYILNRFPTRPNWKRASPIEVLTGRAPSLQGMDRCVSIPMYGLAGSQKADTCASYRESTDPGYKRRNKGIQVVAAQDQVLTTTRHITNIETIDCGQEPEHVYKEVESDHQVVEQIDAQPKASLPSGPRRSQRKLTKSKKQAESYEHGEGRSMKKREKVSSSNMLYQGECTNVVELKTSAKELHVSDPVPMAFTVLPVEQEHEKKLAIPDPPNCSAARRGHDSARWAMLHKRNLRHLRQTKRGR